jgi:hypothetical protein
MAPGSQPYGKYVRQTSSQEPLNGLEPCLAEMFLARSLSSVVTFCSDRSSNMAARGHYGGVPKGRLVYHDHNILYK